LLAEPFHAEGIAFKILEGDLRCPRRMLEGSEGEAQGKILLRTLESKVDLGDVDLDGKKERTVFAESVSEGARAGRG